MSYGVVYTVPAPIEVYDAIHAEAMKQPSDGLMMHLARKVDGGFQVIEVWESKEEARPVRRGGAGADSRQACRR